MTNRCRNGRISVTLNLFQGPFLSTLRGMQLERNPCVYILASGHYGTLYIGVTSDLLGRLWQHRNSIVPGFTQRYGVREKQLKRWHRQWKINLINAENPEWRDLAVGLGFEPVAPRERKDGP